MLCSPFYFQKQTNDKGPVDVKSGGLAKNVAWKKSCQHLITKIMYVTATVYKNLSVTEIKFTYRDGNRKTGRLLKIAISLYQVTFGVIWTTPFSNANFPCGVIWTTIEFALQFFDWT